MPKTTNKIGPVLLPVLVVPRMNPYGTGSMNPYSNDASPQFAFLRFTRSDRTYTFYADAKAGAGSFATSDDNVLVMADLQGRNKRLAVNGKLGSYGLYKYKHFVKGIGAIVRDVKEMAKQSASKLGHTNFAFLMFLDLKNGKFVNNMTEVIEATSFGSTEVQNQFSSIVRSSRKYYINTSAELTTEILGVGTASSAVGMPVADFKTTISASEVKDSFKNVDNFVNGHTVQTESDGSLSISIIGFTDTDEARERLAKLAEEQEAQRKKEEEARKAEEARLKEAAKVFWDENDVARIVHKEAIDKKPETLIIDEVNWKYLVRSIMRGKNLMITGAAGTGKTQAVLRAAKALGREVYNIPLGSTQDPRATLIGNTHFNRDEGTYFVDSLFVKAIQTPNAVILLDELSRANPEAWNILMSVLDYGQRYLRLDESPDSDTIQVADGVCFISTANIGTEYTSTRILDRALSDRFQILEMRRLDVDETKNLLSMLYPAQPKANVTISNIYGAILAEYLNGDKLSEAISTRVVLEFADLVSDGFNIPEAAEVSIYPYFDNDGTESERKFVKQIVQKFIPDDGLQVSKDNHFYIPQ